MSVHLNYLSRNTLRFRMMEGRGGGGDGPKFSTKTKKRVDDTTQA